MPCLSASASKIGGEGENSSIPGTQVMQTVCYMPKQKFNVLHEWGHFISKLWGDTRERERKLLTSKILSLDTAPLLEPLHAAFLSI